MTVDAEPDFTPPVRFEKRPAEQLEAGDLLYLDGETWRVKGRSTSKYSPRIRFTLFPCAGGRPTQIELMPRQWFEIVKVQS